MFDTLVNRIKELSQTQPDKAAVIFKKESLTYGELYHRVLGIAALMKDAGIKPGDRVCFSAVSKPEMVAIYLGIQACEGLAVFLDKNAAPERMAQICEYADARLLLTDKPMKGVMEDDANCKVCSLRGLYAEAGLKADGEDAEVQCAGASAESSAAFTLVHHPQPEDLAEILFTTGTTGTPKGVMLSYRAVFNILSNTKQGMEYTDETVLLLPLPLNHSLALREMRAVLYSGGTVVLQNGFTFAKEVENNIVNFGCNALTCVPSSYEVIKGQMQDHFQPIMSRLSSLEFGAGSISVAQRREIVRMFPDMRIRNVWGSSECGGAIFCDVNTVAQDETVASSLGRALENSVKVAFLAQDAPFDDPARMTGHIDNWMIKSDHDHPGRMAIRGEMLMSGYWKAPELTAGALIDGWLITSDLAYQDEKGNIFMLGRADDIINMGGEKVSPVEVENIVGQYEQIRECACIGVDDPKGLLGQIPVLFIVTGLNYNEADFLKWLSGKLEKTMMPQVIQVVEAIPRNRMQKIDRRALKELWEHRDSLALMNPVVDNILSRRSIRKFTDKLVPREMLDMILRCGYSAPSGHNMQSWRFTVLTKKADILKLKAAAAETAQSNNINMYGFENPQVLILVSNDERNADGCQDASCAVENMMLAARSFGLGSVWLNVLMTLREKEPVKTVLDGFGIPENHRVWCSLAIGWPLSEGIGPKKKSDVVVYI